MSKTSNFNIIKQVNSVLLLICFWLFSISAVSAATLYSRASGGWAIGTWSATRGGASCGCTPDDGDKVIITSPFTVTMGGDLNKDISTVRVESGGFLDGNDKKFSSVADSIIVESGGEIDDIKEMKDLTATIQNAGTLTVNGKIEWKNISNKEVLRNTGTITAKEIKEGLGLYPSPVGTDTDFVTFFNSGTITAEKFQLDGYLLNETTGVINTTTGAAEFHADGMVCNKNIINTTVLKIHGGLSDCSGTWIVDTIEFDENDKQTGSDQDGTLGAGNYCKADGTYPTISGDGIIDSSQVSFCGTILPVELVSFEAKSTLQNTIQLKWVTASELNNSHFEILRSYDGKSFSSIDIVEGMGTIKIMQHYSYITSEQTAKEIYYQLKQVDFDGKSTLSRIASVKPNLLSSALVIRPNPASTRISVGNIPSGITQVSIYNSYGILKKILKVDEQAYIQVDDLASGIYFIHAGTKVAKFIKK